LVKYLIDYTVGSVSLIVRVIEGNFVELRKRKMGASLKPPQSKTLFREKRTVGRKSALYTMIQM